MEARRKPEAVARSLSLEPLVGSLGAREDSVTQLQEASSDEMSTYHIMTTQVQDGFSDGISEDRYHITTRRG